MPECDDYQDDDMTFQFDEDLPVNAPNEESQIYEQNKIRMNQNHKKENHKATELEYEEDMEDKFNQYEMNIINKINIIEGNPSGSITPNLNTSTTTKELIPPENFSPVIKSIYRSSFPRIENFEFLTKLNLKSVLCLIPEEYPQENLDFLESQGIKLFQLGMSGNKEPFVKIPHDLITEAIKIVLNPENQPILIHCNRGKHRTGCLVGVIRRLQKWSLTIIFDEYRKFAAPKQRAMDQQFIELYDEDDILEYAEVNQLLPLEW